MKSLVLEGLEDYARAHTSALDPRYEALRQETYTRVAAPQMQVGHLEGRLLKLVTQIAGARLAVEVGTFTGYSALCIAEGMAEGGQVHTFDVDPVATEVARRHWGDAPWGSRITLHLGDARALLPAFLVASGPIDLAFIDADKAGYIAYWDTIVEALRPGGVVLVDNVLWSGRVLEPQGADDHHIVAFNRHAAADPRVEQVMLTVRDGLLLARKR
ncbi:MAG: class I SAM-dependent methyltransferase [Deltaproteobacteria bacterium]|nr:class I SAM-dependent methyltransferase [Deltaproteobacteria bacterium]